MKLPISILGSGLALGLSLFFGLRNKGNKHKEIRWIRVEGGLGWWVIDGGDLLGALKACANGANPDLMYAEMYANSSHEMVDGNGNSTQDL